MLDIRSIFQAHNYLLYTFTRKVFTKGKTWTCAFWQNLCKSHNGISYWQRRYTQHKYAK